MIVAALPVEFTVPPESRVTMLVDQVDAGPHGISPQIPVFFLVIHENGKFESFLLGVRLNIAQPVFAG